MLEMTLPDGLYFAFPMILGLWELLDSQVE